MRSEEFEDEFNMQDPESVRAQQRCCLAEQLQLGSPHAERCAANANQEVQCE